MPNSKLLLTRSQISQRDGEPVVEAADSRGVYQRSSSRRAVLLIWLGAAPLGAALCAVAVEAMPVMGAFG